MNKKIVTKNGRDLTLNICSFEKANDLQDEFLKTLEASSLTGVLANNDLKDLLNLNISEISGIFDLIKNILTAKSLRKALFSALDKSLLNEERITEALFDHRPECRNDFYEIAFEGIKFFLAPSIESLKSAFQKRDEKAEEK